MSTVLTRKYRWSSFAKLIKTPEIARRFAPLLQAASKHQWSDEIRVIHTYDLNSSA